MTEADRYTVKLTCSDRSVAVRADEPVLSAIERQGLGFIRVGCRGGGCGVCKVRVIEGRYHTGKMSRAHVSEIDEGNGYALSCRLFPVGSLLLETAGDRTMIGER